jgi:hypothetical protein
MQIFLVLITTLFSLFAQARVDDTLPSGVRMLLVRRVNTNDIKDLKNFSGDSESYGTTVNIDAQKLATVPEINEYVLNDLKNRDPIAYEQLSAGTHSFDVQANVDVTAFAFAYAPSNSLMFFGHVPYFNAQVSINHHLVKGDNYAEINSRLLLKSGSGLSLNYESLPTADKQTVQDVITNYYGYAPLGTWYGKGFGDTELAMKYRFVRRGDLGASVTLGAILPTGRIDNADIIQDFGFGQGHLGNFIEVGIGKSLKEYSLSLSSRVDYYHPESFWLRPSATNSDLTEEKYSFKVTPALTATHTAALDYSFSRDVAASAALVYYHKGQSTYESQYEHHNQTLARVSGKNSLTAKGEISLSTVQSYLTKKKFIPLDLSVMVEKTIHGINTPNTTLYSAQLRLFF